MLVFVYGSLKRGSYNSHLLKTATFVGTGITVDKFNMIDVGYPVAFPVKLNGFINRDAAPIYGEVYEIDRDTLRHLDYLENEGRLYHRQLQLVELDCGETLLCRMYVSALEQYSPHARVIKPEEIFPGEKFLVWEE